MAPSKDSEPFQKTKKGTQDDGTKSAYCLAVPNLIIPISKDRFGHPSIHTNLENENEGGTK